MKPIKRLKFGKYENGIRPTNISNPTKIISMLMCMIYQQFMNYSKTGKTLPFHYIYRLPIHKTLNINELNALTWNSSQGIYTPCINLFDDTNDISYNEIINMMM